MEDDDNTPTPTPAPRSRGGSSERELMRLERDLHSLKQSLRAVSKERDTWKEQANTTAAKVSDYDTLKAERDTLQASFDTFRGEATNRLALAEAGVKGKRARRMLIREYNAEHADTPAADRPGVSKWLETLSDDPVLSRLLPQSNAPGGNGSGASDKTTAPPKGSNAPGGDKGTDKPKPKGTKADPNTGTDQPTPGGTDELTLSEYNKLKRNGRVQGDALAAQKAKLKAAGIIR